MTIRFKCDCGREFAVPDTEAGKRAKCRNCGASILIPRAHRKASTAAKTSPQAQSPQEPAEPIVAPWLTPSDPAAEKEVFVGSNDIDNSVIAQMSQPAGRASRGGYQAPSQADNDSEYQREAARRKTPLGIRIAVGIGIAVAVAAAVDALIVLATSSHGSGAVPMAGRGMRMLHAAWLVAVAAGCVVAVAAALGHRVSLGILIGGAFQSIFINTPLLLIGGSSVFSDKLSPDAGQLLVMGGVASLVLGLLYVALLVGLPDSRKYMEGHRKNIVTGAIVGFLSGWAIAVTAIPNPALAATRAVAKPGSLTVVPDSWGGTRPVVATVAPRKDPRVEAKERMATIANAIGIYLRKHGRCFPSDLSELVSAECPAETFVLPASGKAAPAIDRTNGTFAGPIDFVLVMPGYFVGDLPDDPAKLQDYVVCYSDPAWCKNDGGAVMHPPGSSGEKVMYIFKASLESEVDITQTWMREKPSRHQPARPRHTSTTGPGVAQTPGKTPVGAAGKRDIRHDAQVRLATINSALLRYVQAHDSRMPRHLGQLVSPACPASTFVIPGSGHAAPAVNGSTGDFTGPIDFVYIMAGCNVQELPDEPEKLRDFVVCHSDPDMDVRGAAVVLHPPATEASVRVEVIYKAALEQVLESTRTWMGNNPGKPAVEKPSKDE